MAGASPISGRRISCSTIEVLPATCRPPVPGPEDVGSRPRSGWRTRLTARDRGVVREWGDRQVLGPALEGAHAAEQAGRSCLHLETASPTSPACCGRSPLGHPRRIDRTHAAEPTPGGGPILRSPTGTEFTLRRRLRRAVLWAVIAGILTSPIWGVWLLVAPALTTYSAIDIECGSPLSPSAPRPALSSWVPTGRALADFTTACNGELRARRAGGFAAIGIGLAIWVALVIRRDEAAEYARELRRRGLSFIAPDGSLSPTKTARLLRSLRKTQRWICENAGDWRLDRALDTYRTSTAYVSGLLDLAARRAAGDTSLSAAEHWLIDQMTGSDSLLTDAAAARAKTWERVCELLSDPSTAGWARLPVGVSLSTPDALALHVEWACQTQHFRFQHKVRKSDPEPYGSKPHGEDRAAVDELEAMRVRAVGSRRHAPTMPTQPPTSTVADAVMSPPAGGRWLR